MKQTLLKQEKGLGSNFGLATVFITGGCVLVLEILGTKVISPYYGSTVYVWSSLIALTLLALSFGYAFGGIMADRAQSAGLLYIFIALSGLWIALIPLIRNAVLSQTTSLGLIWGSFASAALLFAIPLALLGAAGPMVIKHLSSELKSVGRSAGSVYAISTLGSVAGALLTGYWLIPNMDVKSLLWGLSAILLALASAGLLFFAKRWWALACSALALLMVFKVSVLRTQALATNILFNKQSFYGEIKVVDQGDSRSLLIDGLHNTNRNLRSKRSSMSYVAIAEMLPFMRKDARRALVIGLGGGAIPSLFEGSYGIVTDAVEIDPVIVRAAKDFFDYKPIGSLIIGDGRSYVRRGDKKYDLIFVDVFTGDQQPSHLSTREFFEEIKGLLNPDGILAINRIGWAQNEPFASWEPVYKTLNFVFAHVRVLSTNPPHETKNLKPTNLVFFASDQEITLPDPKKAAILKEIKEVWQNAISNELWADARRLENIPLLTDDFAPLDAWDASATAQLRAALIKNQAGVLLY